MAAEDVKPYRRPWTKAASRRGRRFDWTFGTIQEGHLFQLEPDIIDGGDRTAHTFRHEVYFLDRQENDGEAGKIITLCLTRALGRGRRSLQDPSSLQLALELAEVPLAVPRM